MFDSKKENADAIVCPHCEKVHGDYDDYIEVGDMSGEFEMECENCSKSFKFSRTQLELSINSLLLLAFSVNWFLVSFDFVKSDEIMKVVISILVLSCLCLFFFCLYKVNKLVSSKFTLGKNRLSGLIGC
jgi:hypothetical protein